MRETPDPSGNNRLISRMLDCVRDIPTLEPQQSIALGETIANLRSHLGPSVDAMDEGTASIPEDLTHIFTSYRALTNRLAEGNMRLVASVFKEHPGFYEFTERDREDLFEHASVALLRSAKLYNPWFAIAPDDVKYETIQPAKFSTYAMSNMYFAMLSGMKDFNDMHIPEWRWDQYGRFMDARAYLKSRGQSFDHVSATVLAELIRTLEHIPSQDEVDDYFVRLRHSDSARKEHHKQVASYAKLRLMMNTVSFEELLTGKRQVRDEYGDVHHTQYSLEGVLPDVSDIPQQVADRARDEIIMALLDQIWPGQQQGDQIWYPRERQVLIFRYMEDKKRTLEEIARYYNTSKDTIRNTEARALTKFRKPGIRRMLRDFLTD